MELKNSKTFDHLARAFAGECMARTRYEFAEYGARKAGYDNIAAIIDEIAYQEFNHARMFYTALQSASDGPLPNIDICAGYPFSQRWDLTENLSASAEDEKAEGSEIYPEYARVAEEEGFKDIAGLFRNVAAVELRHERIFRRLLGDLKSGRITFFRLQSAADTSMHSYVAQGEILPVATRSFGGIGIFAIPEMGRFYRHVLIEKGYPHHGAVAFGEAGKILFAAMRLLGVEDVAFNQPKHMLYKTENPFA